MKRRRIFHRFCRLIRKVRNHYFLDRSFGWSRWEALVRAVKGVEEPCCPESKRRVP